MTGESNLAHYETDFAGTEQEKLVRPIFVEDQFPGSLSYAEFMQTIHKQILSK